MPVTASDLIEQTRGHLFTGQPDELNRLSADIADVDTVIPLAFTPAGIAKGTIISVGLEQVYVFVVDTNGLQITDCVRGFNGTVKAAHTSGDIVTVKPKFPAARILQAINDDLADLSSPANGLHQIKTVDLTYNPTVSGYDMTDVTDILDIAEVRYRLPGPQLSWPTIDSYALLRDMPTTGTFGDFASGFAIVVYEGAQPGYPIRVRYRAPFVALSALTDVVTTVTGLPATALDLPPLGAAIRLTAGREVKRNFSEAQGEPRRAEEVPAQAEMGAVRALQQVRQSRIMAEYARLVRAYSYEFVGG